VVLLPPREALYQACDARCVRMIAEGALEEVRKLLELNLDPELPAMKALGVRELGLLMAEKISPDKALEDFQRATRNYAKRQVTWFRHQLKGAKTWDEQYSERLSKEIFSFIRKNLDGFANPG
jgi:tRNA dimethylallyltransferase